MSHESSVTPQQPTTQTQPTKDEQRKARFAMRCAPISSPATVPRRRWWFPFCVIEDSHTVPSRGRSTTNCIYHATPTRLIEFRLECVKRKQTRIQDQQKWLIRAESLAIEGGNSVFRLMHGICKCTKYNQQWHFVPSATLPGLSFAACTKTDCKRWNYTSHEKKLLNCWYTLPR